LVAEAAPRQGHDHHRRHPEADHEVREALGHRRGGEEVVRASNSHVERPVRQYGHEHAAFRVVEHPRQDDGDTDGQDDVQDDVEGAAVGRVPGGYEEQGQVPQGPQDPQDKGPAQRLKEKDSHSLEPEDYYGKQGRDRTAISRLVELARDGGYVWTESFVSEDKTTKAGYVEPETEIVLRDARWDLRGQDVIGDATGRVDGHPAVLKTVKLSRVKSVPRREQVGLRAVAPSRVPSRTGM
jgi:hypothetical protein